MNLREKWERLQDFWDSLMESRVKFGAFCALCGIVIGVALRSL